MIEYTFSRLRSFSKQSEEIEITFVMEDTVLLKWNLAKTCAYAWIPPEETGWL